MKKLFKLIVKHFEKRPAIETILILGTIFIALAIILKEDIQALPAIKYLIEITK